MIRTKLLCGLLALAIMLGTVSSQAHAKSDAQWDLTDIQSFADILAIAIVNDSSVKLSAIQIQEALSGLQSIQAALRPQLLVSGDHRVENMANNSLITRFPGMMEPDDRMSTTSGSFTIAQQLGPNAQLSAALSKANIGKELSVLQQEQALSQLALNVQASYQNVVKANHGLELAKLAVENAKRNVQVAEHKQSIGTATMLDVLQEKNALLEAENRLSGAEMGLNVALLAILQTIGLDRSYLGEAQQLVQQWVANEDFVPVQWVLDFDTAVEYALENRPELIMAASQRQMAAIDYQAYQQKNTWIVNLTGRYMADDVVLDGALDSNRLLRGTVAKSETRLPNNMEPPSSGDTNPWQVGVSVTYTLGDGGSRKAEGEQLQLALDKADIQYASAKDGIYLEIFGRYQQLEQAWRSYQLALQGQEQAQQTYRNLELMYNLGSVTEQELVEGKLYVAQAKNQVISTGLDYQAQKAQLAKALGVDSATLMQAMTGVTKWQEFSVN